MGDFLALSEVASPPIQPRVVSYPGLNSTLNLSGQFGSALSNTPTNLDYQSKNRILQWTDTTLYAVLVDGIYRSTDSGVTFGLVQAFTAPASSNDRTELYRSGVYKAFTGSQVFLVGVFLNTSGNLVAWKYDPETTSYSEVTGPSTSLSALLSDAIVHGDKLYVFDDGQNGFLLFDVLNSTWGQQGDTPTGSPGPYRVVSFCVDPNGLLVALGWSQDTWRLARFSGSWVDLGVVDSDAAGNVAANIPKQRPALFVGPSSDLFAVVTVDPLTATPRGGGFRFYRLTAPYDVGSISNVTGGTLSNNPELRNSDDGGNSLDVHDRRCLPILDGEFSIGSTRIILAFALASSLGTQWSMFEFFDHVSPISFIGNVGSVGDAPPMIPTKGGGGRFFIFGGLFARFVDREVTIGGNQRIDFRPFGGGNRVIRIRYGRGGQPANTLATLTNPVTGGGVLSAPDSLVDVPADGNLHSVVWDVGADGIPTEDPNVVVVIEIGVV